jgi:lysyl-tRNA synthetase class I
MQSSTITVACPKCGRPATVSMHALDERHFTFRFHCPDGHAVPGAVTQQLWVLAHQ